MSENERRRKYRYDRVLIETARVLSSTFDDAVVFLSGAQLEMLRNMTQYLRRIETYVTEYNPGYYLTPTSADYDDILAIVADLEETLMGNPNTLFGYKSGFDDISARTVSGAGDETLYFGAVPSGKVLRLESSSAWNQDTACTKIRIWIALSGGDYIIADKDNPAAGEPVFFDGMCTMPAGSDMKAEFFGCQDGDYIRCGMRGYMMDVPT